MLLYEGLGAAFVEAFEILRDARTAGASRR